MEKGKETSQETENYTAAGNSRRKFFFFLLVLLSNGNSSFAGCRVSLEEVENVLQGLK